MEFQALTNRGLAHRTAGRLAEAEADFRAAMRLSPHPFPRLNLGNLLFDLGRLGEAESLLREARELMPGDWRPAYGLALVLLAKGDFAEGWALYEQRPNGRPMPLPEWTGEELSGRHIVVWPEQGLGDEIMCARWLPELTRRAGQVTVFCSPAVAPLIAQLPLRVMLRGPAMAVPAADFGVRMFSLPFRLGSRPPPFAPKVAPRASAGRIGVKWRGNPLNHRDRWRSLPEATGRTLLALPGAISLEPEDIGAADLGETARVIAGLERVISVDTAVAHLAASLGVETSILLSEIGTDFRWGRRAHTTDWYPAARLLRQVTPGDWTQVLDQAVAGAR